MADFQRNRGRSGVSQRAVNRACRAVGQEQGGTQITSIPYAQVEAGRGDPARENAVTNELIPGEWTSNKPFGSEDNVSYEAPAERWTW